MLFISLSGNFSVRENERYGSDDRPTTIRSTNLRAFARASVETSNLQATMASLCIPLGLRPTISLAARSLDVANTELHKV